MYVAATAESAAKIRDGMIIVRTLEAVVKNKYTNNPGKLAAWTSCGEGSRHKETTSP